MSVAQTILQQLGGNRFVAMTGAKDMVRGASSLQFSLSGRITKDRINKVVIKLEATDLYTIQFYRQRGIDLTEVSRADQVPVENLRETFTFHTGLDTRL